jgi:hypothetical protein
MHGEMINACKILVGKPERTKPLGRDGLRWGNNVNMHLTEVGCEDVDRIKLAQERVQCLNTIMNLRVPYKVGNFLLS